MIIDSVKQNSVLHQIWNIEGEILQFVDSICRKHGLKYSLFYGTMLGAVRHSGFIPWDDDIDILMPREDYDRFVEVWNSEPVDGYLLVNKDFYSDYPNSFMKIVKKNTTFLQCDQDREKSFPKGIFIDIFPADRFAPKGFRRRIQYLSCLVNMLFTREYTSKTGGVILFFERLLLLLPKSIRETCRKKSEKYIQRWNDRRDLPTLVPTTLYSCKKFYPSSFFDSMVEVQFQGRLFYMSSEYDSILRVCFGDYTRLPPESKRKWTHHPLLLDFDHDYEELQQ